MQNLAFQVTQMACSDHQLTSILILLAVKQAISHGPGLCCILRESAHGVTTPEYSKLARLAYAAQLTYTANVTAWLKSKRNTSDWHLVQLDT